MVVPKTPQKRQKTTPTRLLSLHNEQGDGLWILPQHDTKSIYLPKDHPHFWT